MANRNLDNFVSELELIEKEVRASAGSEDIEDLNRTALKGQILTIVGYGTGVILPNPISAYLIALGHFTRWMIGHHVLHGAYDRISEVPKRYVSTNFAMRWRRYIDWFDWIIPEAWQYEHNVLHHYNTSEKGDPDNVERLFKDIRASSLPAGVKALIFVLISLTWKWSYYAPSTLMHLQKRRGLDKKKDFGFYRLYSPFSRNGRELWRRSLLSYALYRFVAIPCLFLPFGSMFALNALLVSIGADMFSNFHGFLMIGPNHTGADLYRFPEAPVNNKSRLLRQILATTSYSSQSPFADLVHGHVNYHIEHHIWPDLTMRQYRIVAPKVAALCSKYGVPYVTENVFIRFKKLYTVCVGKESVKVLSAQDEASFLS